jgi:NodT family efflux transporter outer membrane factor (OMF) lipoprotein
MASLPNSAAVAAVLMLVCGCEVGPSYRTPKTDLPSSWEGAQNSAMAAANESESATTQGPVNESWWKVFKDPELERLEERVTRQNLDVLAATTRLIESRLQTRIIAGGLWPTLNGNASYEREKASQQGLLSLFGSSGSGPSATPGSEASGTLGSGAGGAPASISKVLSEPLNLWQYGFDASWELDLWGGARRALEAARATTQASQEDLRSELLEEMSELARDYIMLRGTQAQRAIVEATLSADRDTVSISAQRANAGLAPQQDVASAEAEVESVAAQIPSLSQQEAQTVNALSLLLATAPDSLREELAASPTMPSDLPSVPLGLPSELARRRPDIRNAEAKLRSATAQVGVAVSQLYPSITLTGSFGLQALDFSNLGSWSARQYAFGPSLTLPLFEAGRLRGTVELRKVQQQEAAIAYQKTVLQAWHDVANALIAYDTEQTRLKRLNKAAQDSNSVLSIAAERYRSGIDPYLNVLTAQRTLLQIQLQAAQSLTSVETDLIQLYKALGGGWSVGEPGQTSN